MNDTDDVLWHEYLSCFPHIPKSSEKDKIAAAWQQPRMLIAQERVYKRMKQCCSSMVWERWIFVCTFS